MSGMLPARHDATVNVWFASHHWSAAAVALERDARLVRQALWHICTVCGYACLTTSAQFDTGPHMRPDMILMADRHRP